MNELTILLLMVWSMHLFIMVFRLFLGGCAVMSGVLASDEYQTEASRIAKQLLLTSSITLVTSVLVSMIAIYKMHV